MGRSTNIESRKLVLVDTNVHVFATELAEETKNRIANDLVTRLTTARAIAVSSQILSEFFDVVTRARSGAPALLSLTDAATAVEEMLLSYHWVTIDRAVSLAAMRAARDYQMRIYDAQVWATAQVHGIETILTEDTPLRPEIEGVRYVNPFTPAFRLEHIGL